jgi:hypothetical protein
LHAVQTIFERNGLQIIDVQEWPTHGGSLRVLAQRLDVKARPVQPGVGDILAKERDAGMNVLPFYRDAQSRAEQAKFNLLEFLLDCKRQNLRVAAYGAAAKGNTLLNFSGIRPDLLPYVVDVNPHKQGKFLPGSRIPIVDEVHLRMNKPNVILILPWNLHKEITAQLSYASEWGVRFIVAIPTCVVL